MGIAAPPSGTASKSGGVLGTGIAVPLRLGDDGRLVMNSLENQVRQSILIILQTAKGERVMRPDFGCGLERFVFEPITPATIALVRHQVKQTLVRYEPRVDIQDVQVVSEPQKDAPGGWCLVITVSYRVRRTDTTFNLVYPFYVERGAP